MKTAFLIFILGAVVMLGAAQAAPKLDPSACKTDVEKFCPGTKPGGGAIETCLKKNESALTTACKQYRQDVKVKLETVVHACQDDIKTHCAGVKPGEGRVFQCLQKKQGALAPACKEQLGQTAR